LPSTCPRSSSAALRREPTQEANGLSDLLDVLLAAIAGRQVSDELAVAVGVEVMVEVIGHELDDSSALKSEHAVTPPTC
jgi:hypothetical protein